MVSGQDMGIMVTQSVSLALRYGRDDISIAMFFHGKNVNSLVLLKLFGPFKTLWSF